MASRFAAILVLFNSTVLSAIVIPFTFEITRVAARAEGLVLILIGIRNRCRTIVFMTVNARCFASSMIARIIAAPVVISIGVGAMIECTLISPAVCCMAGIALHSASGLKMTLIWLRCRAVTRAVTRQTIIGSAGIVEPCATNKGCRRMTVRAI